MIPILPPQLPKVDSTSDDAHASGLVLPDVAVLALQQGRVIEAIKLIRAANPGLDLARAKGMVDQLQRKVPAAPKAGHDRSPAPSQPRTPTVAPGDSPTGLRWLILLVAAAAAGWIWTSLLH